MIRFIQKNRARRGFTMIEMVIVLAIIAVLAAVILPNMSTRNALIKEANTNAKNFYVSVQTIFTKYSLYEADLSTALKSSRDAGSATDFIRYFPKVGGNYPFDKTVTPTPDKPAAADVYLKVRIVNSRVAEALADNSWQKILNRTAASSELGTAFREELNTTVELPDGFYYAKVSYVPSDAGTAVGHDYVLGTVKVSFAAYCKNELTILGSDYSAYESKNLLFIHDNVLADDTVCGVCAPWNGGTKADGSTKITVGYEESYLK